MKPTLSLPFLSSPRRLWSRRPPLLLLLLALLLPLATLPAAPAPAEEAERVAAVINEDIVSMHDLEMRIRMALLASNLPDNMEARSRVAPQVLRTLIDERLEIQEAERLKIRISTSEISNGITTIERQNNMPHGKMEPFLKSKGIDPETMRQQIRAELSWVRVVRRELSPDLRVGEEEIDARLETLKTNLGKPEYLAADIFLAIDNPRHAEETQVLAQRLLEQMKQGAPFSALARQFSQTGASSGGDLGWVSQGMLDEELMRMLGALQPSMVSPPIRTVDGIHLLLLRDRRIAGQNNDTEPTLDLAQIALVNLAGSTAEDRQQRLDRLHQLVAGATSCEDYEKRIAHLPTAEWSHPGQTKPSQLPPEILTLVRDLKVGAISEPLEQDNVRRLFIMCAHTEPKAGLPSRDEVRHRLEDERMELMAKRYLRNLRRAAFIEFRV